MEAPGGKHVYHQHAIVVEPRDRLQTFLKDRGIETGVHYPLPLHRQPSLQHLPCAQERFPNAERISAHGLSLPVCPTLKEADIEYVGSSLRAFFGK